MKNFERSRHSGKYNVRLHLIQWMLHKIFQLSVELASRVLLCNR